MSRPLQSDGLLHGVIVGCRRDDGRWLLIRRSRQVMAPLKVCFPGGAVEVGETHAQAAVREVREELGLSIVLRSHVWTYRAPDRPLLLFGWLAELASGTTPEPNPDPHEVAEVLWLTAREAAEHPHRLPATEQFVEALVRHAEMIAGRDQRLDGGG